MSLDFQSEDLRLFERIATLGSLSQVAREHNVAVSQVTRALARLEKSLRVRLFHRSTHGLSLTDEGDQVRAFARRLLDTANELESDLTGKLAGPAGWVRLGCSAMLAQTVVAPALPGLYKRHPALQMEIMADDRVVDMAREGLDLALRTGQPQNEGLVAQPLGHMRRYLYAAPAYLREYGVPEHPQDLASHRLITSSNASGYLNQWHFLVDKRKPWSLVAQGHTRADSTALTLVLALQGLGIARILDVAARPLVESGQLLPVLQAYANEEVLPIYAVMLQERHRLPKIRACVDYWRDVIGGLNAAPTPRFVAP